MVQGSRKLVRFTDSEGTWTLFPTYMAFFSLFYSVHKPGIELGLSRILRLHSHFNGSDTVTLIWQTHPFTTTISHAQSRNRSSRIAHSRLWVSWKARHFNFPIFSLKITRKWGRVIPHYLNLSSGWFSTVLCITIRFIVYLKLRLSSAHISLFRELLLGS